MIKQIFISVCFVFLIFQTQNFSQSKHADLIIINGNVRTLDDKKPNAEAVAISGNLIIAVGENKAIQVLADKNTKVIDAKGKLIIPGFNDSHVHFLAIGTSFFTVDLRNAKSPEEAVERIGRNAKFLPKDHWILGGYWDSALWKPNKLPRKEFIDAATPNNPVFLYSKNTEIALANSLALKLAGFDKKTKTVDNGEIDRDENGEPTGIIRGEAVRYVKAFTPPLAAKLESAAAETATNYAASLGVTSVQDVHSDDSYSIYHELQREGRLKTRVYDCVGLPDWKSLADKNIKRANGDAMVRNGCLKYFSDGDFEVIPDLLKMMIPADKVDLQVMVHAIGSDANQIVLNVFEQIEKENGKKDRRFRIEHAHRMRSEDIKRFAATSTIASMQPHLFSGGVFDNSEPYRSLLDSGARLSFGSDASIVDLNPLLGIHAAVDRGNSKENSNQAISVKEAVRAYTYGSAYAEFQENVKGTISIGKLADLIILSDDIFTIPTSKIRNVKVLMTIVDGKVVFESK